jgi:hypothetical protein
VSNCSQGVNVKWNLVRIEKTAERLVNMRDLGEIHVVQTEDFHMLSSFHCAHEKHSHACHRQSSENSDRKH